MGYRELIVEQFELRKLTRACNCIDCERIPVKEMLVFEMDFKTARERELVSLYLCRRHYNEIAEEFLQKLKSMLAGKVIDKRVFDIGYVTH